MGSPGPVTPINLEEEKDAAHGGGYLTKGRNHSPSGDQDSREEKMHGTEERRRMGFTSPVTSPPPERLDLSPLALT